MDEAREAARHAWFVDADIGRESFGEMLVIDDDDVERAFDAGFAAGVAWARAEVDCAGYWRERAFRAEKMVFAMRQTEQGEAALVEWVKQERAGAGDEPTPAGD